MTALSDTPVKTPVPAVKPTTPAAEKGAANVDHNLNPAGDQVYDPHSNNVTTQDSKKPVDPSLKRHTHAVDPNTTKKMANSQIIQPGQKGIPPRVAPKPFTKSTKSK